MLDLTQLVTLDELAKHYKVARRTVYGWRRRYGSFPQPKMVLGRVLLFDYTEALLWVQETFEASSDEHPNAPQMQLARGRIE